MNLSLKLALYFVIISSNIDYFVSRPVFSSKEVKRQKRQVVQPTWLSGQDIRLFDPNVHVTAENLKETAALREAIQKAIQDGTFAVGEALPDIQIPTIEESQPISNQETFPQFDFPQWNFQLPSQEQQIAWIEHIQRTWQGFLELSRKWFNNN